MKLTQNPHIAGFVCSENPYDGRKESSDGAYLALDEGPGQQGRCHRWLFDFATLLPIRSMFAIFMKTAIAVQTGMQKEAGMRFRPGRRSSFSAEMQGLSIFTMLKMKSETFGAEQADLPMFRIRLLTDV